jgi:hypothetical protein
MMGFFAYPHEKVYSRTQTAMAGMTGSSRTEQHLELGLSLLLTAGCSDEHLHAQKEMACQVVG